MSNEYRIADMADFVALTDEQRERCVVDMLVWARMFAPMKAAMEAIPGVTVPSQFTWVDDDRIGEISGMSLLDSRTDELVVRVDLPGRSSDEGVN